jgi:hypothetical protein
MLALLVLEEIKNPFLFHESGNEIEFRLAILHHDFVPFIGAPESAPEVAESEVLKNLGQDFRYRSILKDSTVRCVTQEPEPRHYLSLVVGELRILVGLSKLAHKSVEMAFTAVGQRQVGRNVLANDRFKSEGSLLRN